MQSHSDELTYSQFALLNRRRAFVVETWDGVTVEHALDMTSGNYTSPGYEADEASTEINRNFFYQSTRTARAEARC